MAEPRSAAADDPTIAFVRALGNHAVSVIRSDMQLTGKAVNFRQVIQQDFDLTGICRFVLGRYWRVVSPAERRQSAVSFVGRLVCFYGRRLTQSGDGDFGSWLLSIDHPVAAERAGLPSSPLPGPGHATFGFRFPLTALDTALDRACKLGVSLPDVPLGRFRAKVAGLPQTTEPGDSSCSAGNPPRCADGTDL